MKGEYGPLKQKLANTFDLNAVAYIKQNTHFPIIADPSHATGLSELVLPMSLAAAAAGADGLIVEVHPEPSKSLSDGRQSLDFEGFRLLTIQLNKWLKAFDKAILNVQ